MITEILAVDQSCLLSYLLHRFAGSFKCRQSKHTLLSLRDFAGFDLINLLF